MFSKLSYMGITGVVYVLVQETVFKNMYRVFLNSCRILSGIVGRYNKTKYDNCY